MLPCPMPGCGVVISPEKPFGGQQKAALINHLTGSGESEWYGHKGHGLEKERADDIAEKACELAKAVAKVL